MPLMVGPSRSHPRPIRKCDFARTDWRFQYMDICPKGDAKAKSITQLSFDDFEDDITKLTNGFVLRRQKGSREIGILIDEESDIRNRLNTIQPMIEWWMYELEAFQGESDEYWDAINEGNCKPSAGSYTRKCSISAKTIL
ncbi:hypothetical protein QL093DRAFT_2082664 [Fusarium oxysporum]|nr:hypothetical protein QL093DRAFT_2082664 [Fusarium oxysporum]